MHLKQASIRKAALHVSAGLNNQESWLLLDQTLCESPLPLDP